MRQQFLLFPNVSHSNGVSMLPATDLQPTAVATVTAVRVTDHGEAVAFPLPQGNKLRYRSLGNLFSYRSLSAED